MDWDSFDDCIQVEVDGVQCKLDVRNPFQFFVLISFFFLISSF